MIKNRNGVTLIEVLVTGIILAILAGGLLSILHLNVTETREGVLSSRLQMQYDNIVEQISRDARSAKLILTGSETTDQFRNGELIDQSSVNSIWMYDDIFSTIPYAGYDISSGILKEYDPVSKTMITYMSGNSDVTLAAGSHFKLFGLTRKNLEVNLDVESLYKGKSETLVSNAILIKCRN